MGCLCETVFIGREYMGSLKHDGTVPSLLRQLHNFPGSQRSCSMHSNFTTYADDDKEVWRQFRRDLIKSGFRSDDIYKHSLELKDHLCRLRQSASSETEGQSPPYYWFVLQQPDKDSS